MGRLVFWLVQALVVLLQGTTEQERAAWREVVVRMFKKREVRIGGREEDSV